MDDFDEEEDFDDDEEDDDPFGGMGAIRRRSLAKAQPAQVLASRRKLNHVLQQLYLGVTGVGQQGMPSKQVGGLLASLGEKNPAPVEEWVAKMDEVLTAINDVNNDEVGLYKEALDQQVAVLRDYVGVKEGLNLPGVPAEMIRAAEAAMAGADEQAPTDEGAAPFDELAPAFDELAP